MRPLSFDPQALRKHLLRHKIATLPELKTALGTSADLTVFRKLKLLDYLSSYTHRGRYYALREAACFDDAGWHFPKMAGLSLEETNELNRRIIDGTHRDGRVFLSSTMIDGKFTLRMIALSFRTHKRTIDLALRVLKEQRDALSEPM